MSIDISHETETRLIEEALRQSVSVETLLSRFVNDRSFAAHVTAGMGIKAKVPVLHLGEMGSLHRRDLYAETVCPAFPAGSQRE